MSIARLLFACILSLIISPAIGGEISRHPSDSAKLNAVYFSGVIERGDAAKLKRHLGDLPTSRPTVVYLSSDGGSLRDGINMGYLFRTEGVRTAVESRGRCVSACAYAFLGGYDKATAKPWRTMATSSKLAFHGFYVAFKKASYTPDEVNVLLYDNTLAASSLVKYFKEVDGDWDLLSAALRLRGQQLYQVTDAQALEIGINVYDEASKKMRYADTEKAY